LKLSPKKYRKYLLEEFEEGGQDYTTKFRNDHPELFKVDVASG
jgi:adenine-specific DNA methylase